MKVKKKDLTGQRFGRVIVLKESEPHYPPNSNKRLRRWLCQCDCGNEFIAYQNGLLNGSTKSCSCLRKENFKKHKNKYPSNHRLNRIWVAMRQRCSNQNNIEYKNYGARGISVCNEWNNPQTGYDLFYEWSMKNGYADNLTIDRIDNNKGYSPDNCRWLTHKEQQSNRSDNHFITFNGTTKTVSQWAEYLGIKRDTLFARIRYGWSIERALFTPIKKKENENE